ncbi:unnamed protein product [Strongylus vulgaris]|uniref:Uncharacterized protein n=1 Tax=Strongylus vulgaris TaxID=40348 RepID=A0A3P7JVK5_STRVU|nr:unnamed protein product [Strongylus vulgaris]
MAIQMLKAWGVEKVMGVWRNCVHVTVVSPMLLETDRHGFLQGMVTTAIKYFSRSCELPYQMLVLM